MRRTLTASIQVTAAVVALAAAFGVGREIRERLSTTAAKDVPVEARPKAGRQLLFVYIGSSRCGPSNQSDVLGAVKASIASFRERAAASHLGFATLGVARELSPTEGLAHLGKIGRFDEMAVGQGDLNQASIRFVARDHPGIGATPQVLIVERDLPALGNSFDNVAFTERILVRKVGAADIARWVQRGSPIPSEVMSNNTQRGSLP